MTVTQFEFKNANRFLAHIVLIGLGIGTANYTMNSNLNWIQCAILSLSTSFLIGYTTILIASNKSWLNSKINPNWKIYVLLSVVFLLAGIMATEIEHIIRSLIFNSEPFLLLSSGKMYLFNGVISSVLGFRLYQNNHLIQGSKIKSLDNKSELGSEVPSNSEKSKSPDISLSIPVRQGDNIQLIPTQDIVYFEAYDNYSFLYDVKGQKRLCDYSLLFLEKRLDHIFSRIHRKYLVNKNHIKQIKPHINGRYVIEFSLKGLPAITSSKTYSSTIRRLIKIE